VTPLCAHAQVSASDDSHKPAPEEVKDESGNTFMEEVPSKNPPSEQQTRPKIVPDLTRINVPVDPNGKIVPLKNTETGPVLPFYSKMEQSFEPLYQPTPVWGYPYGGIPIYGLYPYGFGRYAPGPSIGIRFGGGPLQFGFGTPTAVPVYPAPYGFGPGSPWFVPPGVMPNTFRPNPFVYSPAYPLF